MAPPSAFAKASADRRSFSGGWSGGRAAASYGLRGGVRSVSLQRFVRRDPPEGRSSPASGGWPSGAYWETHRRLEREGKLTHSSETCPERLDGKVVKIWQRETGWKDVNAPQAFAPVVNATR